MFLLHEDEVSLGETPEFMGNRFDHIFVLFINVESYY